MNLESWTSERLLLERGAELSGPAFAAFYRRHERPVLAYHLRRVAGNADLASELAAETFAQALGSRHRFQDRGAQSGIRWLFGIARNVLGASARRAASDKKACADLGLSLPALPVDAREELARLATEQGALEALGRLPKDQRQAIEAYFLGDESYADIANRSGHPEPTIRKRVSRGIASLRREMKESA